MTSGSNQATGSSFEDLLDSILASYGQVLFSRSRVTGLLVMMATLAQPRLGIFGLGGVLLCNLLAWVSGMDRGIVTRGLFGVNGLLLGLAFTVWFVPSIASTAVFAISCVGLFAATAALRSILGRCLKLPPLSVPFHLIFYGLLASSAALPELTPVPLEEALPMVILGVPLGAFEVFLRSMAAIFFLQGPVAGALVTLALLFATRAGFMLALLGFMVAMGIHAVFPDGGNGPCLECLGANCALTAMATGTIFFLPSLRSTLLALISVLLAASVHFLLTAMFSSTVCPPLFLPFNIVTIVVIAAQAARTRNRDPVPVFFPDASPEKTLGRHNMEITRFEWTMPTRFSLPFMGSWTVTQGWNEEPTHLGRWSQAWDFEVFDSRSSSYEGDGEHREDYHCFRLPVLSAADGVVVSVDDRIPDKVVGTVDMERNWGNNVVIGHGGGLFTMSAHLAHDSVEVEVGQEVRRGQVVARCGSTGRSPVPHLHFQFQASGVAGGWTIPGEFHDTRVAGSTPVIGKTCVPVKGETVSNPIANRDLVSALTWLPGRERSYRIMKDGRSLGIERVRCEADEWGGLVLRSDRFGASLCVHHNPPCCLLLEKSGGVDSILGALYLAMPRVPHGATAGDTWRDRILVRPLLTAPLRWVADAGIPLGLQRWRTLHLEMSKDGEDILLLGRHGNGRKVGETRCILSPSLGINRVLVESAGSTFEGVLQDEG